MSQCIEPFVGKILASWRYDISGLAPEMSTDYESHLAQCARCRSRQLLHRTIDMSLIGLSTVSAIVCVLAFFVIRHITPDAILYEIGSLCGIAFFALVWLVVAVSTPAPVVIRGAVKGAVEPVKDAALSAAQNIHDRLPENIRDSIPEELRVKIAGGN